ncbi:MAG: Wadjet anti-phage system protein JetD domain-containing protein [Pseudomonadota bacterium]
MNWTTESDIVGQLRKLWEQGTILAAIAGGEEIFPRRMVLKKPKAAEMAEHFSEVRAWIAALEGGAKQCRVVRREIHHRTLGTNTVPAEVWVDSLAACLTLIGKRREADRFVAVVEVTAVRYPQLIAWLVKRPLQGLALAGEWPRLLDIVAWLEAHPRPGIYLRQVDIAGVHSKFIESHRGVLAELFDLVLPQDSIDETSRGAAGFCRRYGFRDKSGRVRFRLLDPSLSLLAGAVDQDFTVSEETFARLDLPVTRVYITENEINFLAFPQVPKSMVIFGAGYGFGVFAEAVWLQKCSMHYWGDIDTHGFAILDQLRSLFPAATSLLMDRETLLAHRPHWGQEPLPSRAEPSRLTPEEHLLYDDLRGDRLAVQLRLEQERIGFSWVEKMVRRTHG